MSEDEYYETTKFVCFSCGKEYDVPGMAEACYKHDRLRYLISNASEHPAIVESEVIDMVESLMREKYDIDDDLDSSNHRNEAGYSG